MLIAKSDNFAVAWVDNRELSEWLAPYNIRENVKMLHEYDFTCPFIPDSDLP
jgi:hypothetical protein